MIKNIADIMTKNFQYVSPIDGINKVMDICIEKKINFFPIIDNNEVLGVITNRNLLQTHPNRIVADAPSSNYFTIAPDTPVWTAKEIFDSTDHEALIVSDHKNIKGILYRNDLYIELGKHSDLLTGLYKSDYIYYNCIKYLKSNTPFCILFIDVNNFGMIDKRYGHTIGDSILKEISHIIKKVTAKHFHLCRYGGDEFAILSTSPLEETKAFAEILIDSVKRNKFKNNIKASVSIGIVYVNVQVNSINNIHKLIVSLINLASLSSTKAKAYKNNIVICEDINLSQHSV